jgi:hypothetical protein
MEIAHILIIPRQAMNHDVATGGDATLLGPVEISGIRIGNVNGAVKPATRVSPIQNVYAFRGSVVPLPGLGTDRVSANGNPITPQNLTTSHQKKEPLLFDDDDLVSMNNVGKNLTGQTKEECTCNAKDLFLHIHPLSNRFVTTPAG